LDHITIKMGVEKGSQEEKELLAKFKDAQVVVYGEADNRKAYGDQNEVMTNHCFLVEVNGERMNPYTKQPWHITCSYDLEAMVPGCYNKNGKPSKAKPYHSGYVASHYGMETFANPFLEYTFSAKFYPDQTNNGPNAGSLPQCNK